LLRYRHAELGFTLDLPYGMEVIVELPPTVALEPTRDWSFQPTCVVTAEPRPPGLNLEAWVDAGWQIQEERLFAARLIDRQATEIGGAPAVQTLAHHTVRDHAVTLEQWWLLGATRGWALSASCATLDYDGVTELFRTLASGFEPSSA